MKEELFARYAQLKRQMAELDDEIEELKPKLAEELKTLPDSKLKTDFGAFSIQRKARWTYSEVAQQLESELKTRQKQEQQDGIATAEYSEFVQFKAANSAVA